MSKLKYLQKKLMMQAAVIFGAVAACGAILAVTASLETAAAQRRTNAQNAINNDNAQIASMRAQLDKSGEAAKRFVKLEIAYPSGNFNADTDAMKNWLRNAKEFYRFSDRFKLTLAMESPAKNAALGGPNFTVLERDPMKLEFDAMSDIHVFSFLDDLLRHTPGFIRMRRFELTRKTDMDAASFQQMRAGVNPDFVSASLEFLWVGIEAGPARETTAPATANPPGTGM